MRVISGRAKGRVLSTPKGSGTRFTSDKVKGAIFNILGPDLNGKSFLDLFAGAGNVGIEALSRGAKSAVFVEKGREKVNFIRRNLQECRFSKGAVVYNLSYKQALKRLSHQQFHYIFLDPPYCLYSIKNILQELIKDDIITRFSKIIVEHSRKDIVPAEVDCLNLSRQKKYGQTILSFYASK